MTSFIAVCTKESGKRPTITKRGLRAVMVACRRSLRHCPSARRMLGLGMLQFKWWGTCSEALHYVRAAKASLEGEPGMAFERGQLVIAEKILQEARSRFLGIELERQPYEPQLVNDNGQPLHAQGLQYNA